jgi:two-component sensor histidine kinase/CheY-like chemotaxis protein
MPNRTIRVLYIDDDPGLSRLVQRTLERRGYEVELASDGETGLAKMAQSTFDVVGLDHYLPTGTGIDVLAKLREGPSAPTVVYVTGSAETDVAVAALKLGAYDYVTKSVAEDFLELLGTAIDQAAERARLTRAKEKAEAELREAKERAEMLLGEVNHRVANSLAMVAALVRMQANAVSDSAAKAALAETQARISAIAGVHRRLYTSDDVRFVDIGEYLASLAQELDTSIGTAGHGRLKLDLQPVRVPTDKAVSIGVITAELVTNAIKYAYPEGSDGEVRLGLTQLAGENSATLTVEDDGIGYDGEGPVRGTGLGTRLIRSMAATLGTTVAYQAISPGTRATLHIAL